MKRVFNFNAGPSALPLSVLERIREELLDWRGSGMSVMEMSHRSPEFEGINAAAEAGLRKHLAIPDDYSGHFSARRRQHAVYAGADESLSARKAGGPAAHRDVDGKALAELKKGILHKVAATTEPVKFTRVPRKDEISPSVRRFLRPHLHQQHH